MPLSPHPAVAARVVAILVVCDGAERLGDVLAAVAAFPPEVELLVVDNGIRDGFGALLRRRIPSDRLLRLHRKLGYGAAVTAALRHEAVADADYVLLLHDDLALAPDAVPRLVEALEADSSLWIVGPKLRQWDEAELLQDVGMTIDQFGRADSPLEPPELDQGQHDHPRDVLYVSTAGMLVRRRVFARLGGFDERYPVMRDDLDLCWRAWLAGGRVTVVPEAVGYHVAAMSALHRPVAAGESWEARYVAERHTIATLLKNVAAVRLLWLVPVLIVLLPAKVLAFLLTRRVDDARAVAWAVGWNVRELPRTLERRSRVQALRRVSDQELTGLFSPVWARLRAYAEAVGGRLRGAQPWVPASTTPGGEAGRHPFRRLRAHPVAWSALALFCAYVAGLLKLLGRGPVVGGQIAPWPDSPHAFLEAYAGWSGGPLASAGSPSPLQAVLGVLSFAGLGSPWLAQRLLVFGLVPLAWLLALQAGRLLGTAPGPRILGASLYALSPVLLGALALGRLGALVAAALLPGIVLLAVETVASRHGRGWRAAAMLAIVLAVVAAAEPVFGLLLIGIGVVVALWLVRSRGRAGRARSGRLILACAAAVALLGPWLVDVVAEPTALPALWNGVGPPAVLPLWRAVTITPGLLPGLEGTPGIVLGFMAVAVVVAALLYGLRGRPATVAGLACVVGCAALGAWAVSRTGASWLWPPVLLVPGALALAALAVVAAPPAALALRGHRHWGARAVGAVLVLLLAVGLGSSVVRLTTGPWQGLSLDPELVPAFVSAGEQRVGPYRVLVLHGGDRVVRWDVTEAGGPSMLGYGALPSTQLVGFLENAVAAAVGGRDPGAAALLGLANVRYVVVAASSEAEDLLAMLARQVALEPLPAAGGRVLRVRSWLPRAVAIPEEDLTALLAGRIPDGVEALEEQGLAELRPGVYDGRLDGDTAAGSRILVVSEAASPLWSARWKANSGGGTSPLERHAGGPVNAFRLPAGPGRVSVATAIAGRRLLVAAQALLVVGLLSVIVSPPFGAGRLIGRAHRRGVSTLAWPTWHPERRLGGSEHKQLGDGRDQVGTVAAELDLPGPRRADRGRRRSV
jgi:GT2 family glycosyltransferase